MLIAATVLYVGGDYLLSNYLILPGFTSWEVREAKKDVARCLDAVKREAYHLGKLAGDWALWDDMYQYVQDGNEAFAKSNFQWESLASSDLNLVYVCDNNITRVSLPAIVLLCY